MSAADRKRCLVAYATEARQYVWTVELEADASIDEALGQACRVAGQEGADVPWHSASVGIFGELRSRGDIPLDGDRIEIYRTLRHDPKESRRTRAKDQRATRRRSGI